MINTDNVLNKFLDWKDGWENYEIVGDEPPILTNSDIAEFEELLKQQPQSLKNWIKEYNLSYWNNGLQEKDRAKRKALFFGNSVTNLPDRKREGCLLESFWNTVGDVELEMIRTDKAYNVTYFDAKVKRAKLAVDDAKKTLDYYTTMLERARAI